MCYSPWGHRESDTTEQLNIREIMSYSDLSVRGSNRKSIGCLEQLRNTYKMSGIF